MRSASRIPGVQRATASIASNSVTVEYDETVTSVAALRDKVNECGFHCTGQIMRTRWLKAKGRMSFPGAPHRGG